jgi:hypothetical protein
MLLKLETDAKIENKICEVFFFNYDIIILVHINNQRID